MKTSCIRHVISLRNAHDFLRQCNARASSFSLLLAIGLALLDLRWHSCEGCLNGAAIRGRKNFVPYTA